MLAIHTTVVSLFTVKRVERSPRRPCFLQAGSVSGREIKIRGVPLHLFMLALSYTRTSCCFAFVAVIRQPTAARVWTPGFHTFTIFLIRSCMAGGLLFSSLQLCEVHKYFLSALDPELAKSTTLGLMNPHFHLKWISAFLCARSSAIKLWVKIKHFRSYSNAANDPNQQCELGSGTNLSWLSFCISAVQQILIFMKSSIHRKFHWKNNYLIILSRDRSLANQIGLFAISRV